MFFPVITQFSNLVISKRCNLVIFKRWDGFKDEKFWNYAGLLKIPIYRGFAKKQYIGRNCLKGELTKFVDLRRACKE